MVMWGHLQANAMWMKSIANMSCQSIRLLETIFSSSKTIPVYLQYGKDLFASLSCHTPLTGLPGINSSHFDHPWDILGRWVHDRIPSKLPHFPNWNTSWLDNGNAFHMGVQPPPPPPRLLLSMRERPMECSHKGVGHPRYDLQYTHL